MIKRINTAGFSLIEIAAVIIIIGIISATAVPQFFSLSEDADAETLRAVVSDVEMSVEAGVNRGIAFSDLKNARLGDIVDLVQESFTDGVTVTSSGVGALQVVIAQSGATRTATLTMQSDGSVKITTVSGFTRYTINSGDLQKI